MAADDVEAFNKIRIAMGYDPLPAPGGAESGPVFQSSKNDEDTDDEGPSTVNSRQALASDNWTKLEAKRQAEADRQARKEKIRKDRERAQLNKKLEGKGLGEADDEELDTKSWLLSQKKRQKKLDKARKMQAELEERERLAQERDYTSTDLAGVKVGHELGQFDEGADQILTLKDTGVEDSDAEDELENAVLREREKAEERIDNKKRKRVYDPNDLDDGTGKKSLLAQYDDVDGPKKAKRFTLDGSGSTVEAAQAIQDGATRSKGVTISLDILNDDTVPISDYAEATEVKVKKPKKKKSKHTRKKAEDKDDTFPTNGAGPIANSKGADVTLAKKGKVDADIFDDDDLQSKLAQQRREALKKRKKTRPEDLARQIREENSAPPPDVMDTVEDGEEEGPGLVIDETIRFVANLEKPPTPPPAGIELELQDMSSDMIAYQGDINMDEPEDATMEDAIESKKEGTIAADGEGRGLEEEATVGGGMGAALKLLRGRGLVEDANGEALNAQHRARQEFLAHKGKAAEEAERRAKHQRDVERQSGRYDHMSAKDREERARVANNNRDNQEQRRLAEMFNKEYRPNIELRYHDEYGRDLGQKEAFKHLSHQFHGKGSGKGKTEKTMKKIEDERRRMAQSSLDDSTRVARNQPFTGDEDK